MNPPYVNAYGYGMALKYFLSLDGFIHPLFLVWTHGGVFVFYQGSFFSEVHCLVALPQPHSKMWTRLPPCFSPAYGTWQFCCSRLPRPYFYPAWFHWVSLSILQGNLGGLPPPVTPPQSWKMMSWGWQVPGTHQLPSRMEKLCRPILPYPMTIQMHIKLPYLPGLWTHLPTLVILPCIFPRLVFLSVCVHHHSFLYNFGRWIAWNSVLAWDVMLVYYRLLQFRPAIHDASDLHVILCHWYCDW